MADIQTVKVPDIGDFEDVEVIEVLVKPGATVQAEDSLITLESDKASMEIPAPQAGTVVEILVAIGDKVSEGSPIATLQPTAAQAPEPAGDAPPAIETTTPAPAPAPAAAPAPAPGDSADVQADVVVLGSGPGGYTAAFRAADLGLNTVLVERYPKLGGVCLNVGCIPSKALLHTAEIITETATMADHGVSFGPPQIDLDKLRGFKDKVIGQLTGGLAGLARQRKVTVIHGTGSFASPNRLTVETAEGARSIDFRNAIIAVGS
jgi:dihydrolipoamide dehydrogenase